MTLSRLPIQTIRTLLRLAPLGLAALAAQARADWTVVRAEPPVTTIHETGLYQAHTGQHLATNDIVETPPAGGAQLQDEHGNVIALGPDTRVLLGQDTHLALLGGWLKLMSTCAAASCPAPVVETPRTRFTAAGPGALVIAAAPAGYDGADAVFCESAGARLLALGRARGKPAQAKLDAHQFAQRAKANETITTAASPDSAFVAAMPIAFRDALRALPAPAAAASSPALAANGPGAPKAAPPVTRPVAYAELSDWLTSALAARNDPATRFADRFRARLADPAFKRDVKQHIRELPDWRALVFPPPRHVSRNPSLEPPSAYPSIYVRP